MHQIIGPSVTQKGSFVGSEKLTFDFNASPLTQDQLHEIEECINEEILKNHPVLSQELPYAQVKERNDIMQLFGEKYGDRVRIVQIGGELGLLNGFSMELCGGTHVRHTGEIGQLRIVSEGAVSSGIRRIEAVAGRMSYERSREEAVTLRHLAARLRAPLDEIEKKLDFTLSHISSLEKELEGLRQRIAEQIATSLLTQAVMLGTIPTIIATLREANARKIEAVTKALREQNGFDGVVLLAGIHEKTLSLMAAVSPPLTKTISAHKLIQLIAPIIGGKGGGTPPLARGGGPGIIDLPKALHHAQEYILLTNKN